MLPTQTDVHIDYALTDFAVRWKQQNDAFVCDKVFSSLPVEHATNKYFTFNREDFYRDQGDGDMLLAPSAPVKRGGYRISNDSYSTDVRAWGKAVPKEIEANADGGLSMERDAIDYVMTQLMIRKEAGWLAAFFATGKWTTDITPTNLWSDFTTSDPKADIETGVLTIESSTGYRPNTLTVGARVHSKLKQHPIIRDQFKYTSAQSITEEMLAAYFEIDNYIVARAVKSTTAELTTVPLFDYMAGKHALLSYKGSSNTEGPTAGRTFNWKGWGNDTGVAVQSYYEQSIRSNIVEGFTAYAYKVVSADLGYFFNGAVS